MTTNAQDAKRVRVALYARVSTSDRGQETETQLHALREWADRQEAEVVAEYVDQSSGSRADRTGLRALLEAAHRRDFDVVLVWALDRLSREGIGPMVSYLEKLKAAGVVLRSHQEPWLDTASPVNDLLLAIFSWVASQERERIRERVKAGLARARAQGRRLGRPRALLDIDHARRLLNDEGLSLADAARRLGCSRATLARRLAAVSESRRQ